MSQLEGVSPELEVSSAPSDEGWCCCRCAALVEDDWLLCPYCGQDLSQPAETATEELEESNQRHRPRPWLAGLVAILLVGAGVGVWLGFFRPSSGQQLTGAWMALHRQLTAKSVTAAPAPRTPAAVAARVGDVYRDFAATVGGISLPATDEADAHAVIRDAIAVANDYAAATWTPPGVSPAVRACSPLVLLCTSQAAEPARAYPGSWNFPPSLGVDQATFDQDVAILFADLGVAAPPS
jgi:hypothetical protein